MAAFDEFTHIFAITAFFAFLDAWNIGANDVANSFATSVSSRSLTLKQAMAVAAVMEFSGSVSVGSRVADTIRTHIIDEKLYRKDPAVLLLAMMCALVGSSIFLTMATRHGFPVSTTHSIIGGFVGAGTASMGITKIRWGWNGVTQVFAAWIIAPGMAGVIGALMFLTTKRMVLMKPQAAKRAFWSIPIYTFAAVAALTMLVAWKGIQLDDYHPSATEIVIIILSVATGAVLIQAIFVLPFLWCRVVREDWQLKWFDLFHGPFLLRRPQAPPPPPGTNRLNIKDYYHGYLSLDELKYIRQSEQLMESVQHSHTASDLFVERATPAANDKKLVEGVPPRPPGPWNSFPVLIWRLNRILLRGVERDVINFQKRQAVSVLDFRIEDIHARCTRFDNGAEYMYSALQIVTAATNSFIHGANDVANAVAPFTSAYYLWRKGEVTDQVSVPIWVLCFGGGAIVLGLLTYGYHVIRNMGNRMTLISPSRGFCMELGSAITVLVATRFRLPVSTTQCIAGATVGVGLANGDWRAVNGRLVAWVYFGWVITVPATAFLAGALMAFVLGAPRWGKLSNTTPS